MRCSKCGAWSLTFSKYCPKCGQEFSKLISDKKNKRHLSHWSAFFLIGIFTFVLLGYLNQENFFTEDKNEMIDGIVGFGLLILILVALVLFFTKIIKGFVKLMSLIKNGILAGAVLGLVIIGIIGGCYYWYSVYSFNNLKKNLVLMQDGLVEVMASQRAGDFLIAGGKNLPKRYNWKFLQEDAATMAESLANIDDSGTLKDYEKVVTVYAAKVRDSLKNNQANLENQPGEFNLILSQKKAEILMKATVSRIGILKEFGDEAIKNKDMVAMNFIVARLAVQNHWLLGLQHYQKSNFSKNFINNALAYGVETNQICFTTYSGKPLCAPQVTEMTTEAYNAANNYLKGDAKAVDSWNKAWSGGVGKEITAVVNSGHPLETMAGVVAGQEKPKEQPRYVTNFINNCYAAGGTLGGANQIVDRIMTTEAGRYCAYKVDGNNCWRYLTYSGAYYASGDNNGCLEFNVIPRGLAVINQRIEELLARLREIEVEEAQQAQQIATPKATVKPKTATATAPKPSASVAPTTSAKPKVIAPTAPVAPAPSISTTKIEPEEVPVVVEPAPAPVVVEKPVIKSWSGDYQVTSWSGTCHNDNGQTWAAGSPYGTWEVKSNGQICGMCGCATVSAGGSYHLDCVYNQAWGNNYQVINLTFSLNGNQATASGIYHYKTERLKTEFGSEIEPNSTSICDSTFSLSRYSN
jgi:hypothetical protein